MTQLPFRPATELAAAIRGKEISSTELAECYLDRIETLNPGLGTVGTVAAERACSEAGEADRRLARAEELGPLHGLPMTVRDCLETAGVRTTCGARELADYVPDHDAEAVGGGSSRRRSSLARRTCRRGHRTAGPTTSCSGPPVTHGMPREPREVHPELRRRRSRPQGRVGADPEPVGTLIRPAAMRDLARKASYADAEILPIEHPVWRFYRVAP